MFDEKAGELHLWEQADALRRNLEQPAQPLVLDGDGVVIKGCTVRGRFFASFGHWPLRSQTRSSSLNGMGTLWLIEWITLRVSRCLTWRWG